MRNLASLWLPHIESKLGEEQLGDLANITFCPPPSAKDILGPSVFAAFLLSGWTLGSSAIFRNVPQETFMPLEPTGKQQFKGKQMETVKSLQNIIPVIYISSMKTSEDPEIPCTLERL